MKTRQAVALLLLGALLVFALANTAPAYAQDPDPPGPGPEPGTGEEGGVLGDVQEAVGSFLHTMIFPIESMTMALRRSLEYILAGTFEGLADLYAEAMQTVAFGEYARGPSPEVVQPLWSRVLAIAAVLWPLTLGLNVLAVARGGVAANAVGYADLKEAIIEWIGACVGAAASLYLLRWGVGLSNAIGNLLMPHDAWEVAQGIGNALADTGLITAVAEFVPGGLIFMMVFILSLGFAMMTAFLFSFLARYVILFALITIAPLTLTLGAVPATRWLSWMWLKGVVLVLLLRPINSVLISLAFSASANGAMVIRLFIVAGILSILLAINYAVANAVFAAIGEVAKKAKATTEQVIATAVLAVGAAAGGVAALGGAGALAAGGAGAAAGGGAAGGAGGGGAATAASGAAGSGAGGGAGGTAGGAAATGAAGSGAGPGTGGSGIAGRVQSALSDPNVQRRLGRVASNVGRGIQFTARGPVGRAAGAVIGGGGDLMADQGQERANARRDRYFDQHRTLAGWGMDPRGRHFYDVAEAQQQLEGRYQEDDVAEFAAPTARMMAAAEQRGADLGQLAQQAGFSSAGEWFGNRVEGGIRGKYGGRGTPLFSAGRGLQTPSGWTPGNLTAFDYNRGLELAQMLGRTGHENQIGAYAELVHTFRNPSGGGQQGAENLLAAARSVRGQHVGQDNWRAWAPFANAAEQMAGQYGINLTGAAAAELDRIRTFQPDDPFA